MADEKFEFTLEKLYAHLSPSGSDNELRTTRPVDSVPIEEVIKGDILGANGHFYGWNKIADKTESYFKKSNQSVKVDFGKKFHAISTESRLDLGDKLYWGEKVKNLSNIVPALNPSLPNSSASRKKCVVSAFVSRDPYISPATRATRDVELFLNYIPNLFASQMVPFLDVEFDIPAAAPIADKNGSLYANTPSYMRFLFGSINTNNDKLSSSDRFLFNSEVVDPGKTYTITDRRLNKEEVIGRSVRRPTVRSGVEMFLMPQTLTNMGNLAPGPYRLVQAKPFVPYASIESFDVQVRNAGAGAMVHKTADLKIKVHDKSRISEFSQLIRGPSGYSGVTIWTTYGWSAPQDRGFEDSYSRFINEKMYIEDCWMIKDTQFSFDASGQVSFTIQLVSKGIKDIQKMMISSAGGNSITNSLNELKKAIQTISNIYDKLRRSEQFSVDATSADFINAAASTGNVATFKNISQIVTKIKHVAERSGVVTAAEVKELSANLSKVGATYNSFKDTIPATVTKLFDNLKDGEDPFLPRKIEGEVSSESPYFPSPDLVKVISEFDKASDERNKEIEKSISESTEKAEEKIRPIRLDKSVKIVSFGKVFMNFIAQAVLTLDHVDELQVFFYPLNDSVGPLSGHSIAEFPIDAVALAYAYVEELKLLNIDELTLEQFMKLVINSQFADIRAIGYGKNHLYKPAVPGKKEQAEKRDAKDDSIERGEADWAAKWGGWRPPMIDVYVETGEDSDEPSKERVNLRKRREKNSVEKSGKYIKRIHVFDKQLDPHRLAKSILMGEEGLERGDVNKGRIQGILTNSMPSGKDAKKQAEILQKNIKAAMAAAEESNNKVGSNQRLNAEGEGLKAASANGLPISDLLKSIDRPGRGGYKLNMSGNKREAIKAELMRFVPTLIPGTNGSMIRGVSVGSKTDGTMGAANLFTAVKGGNGKNALSDNGLEEANNLPLRVVPVQLTMTTYGCPTAGIYQDYFIDLGTGTTIDNLYKCTQVNHSLAQGKFESSWTFVYTDGYGRFGAAPTVAAIVNKEILKFLDEYLKETKPTQK